MQSDNVGMVELRHDGRLPLQVLPGVGILDLADSDHLQGHLLVQDDVVGQDHLAEGSLAESCRSESIVSDVAGKYVMRCLSSNSITPP